MTKKTDRRDDDHDISRDAGGHDWEWRRKIRSNPHSHLIYRIVVGVVGTAIFVLGLIMVPFPGPGWLVVLLGLAVLASEFTSATACCCGPGRRSRPGTSGSRRSPGG